MPVAPGSVESAINAAPKPAAPKSSSSREAGVHSIASWWESRKAVLNGKPPTVTQTAEEVTAGRLFATFNVAEVNKAKAITPPDKLLDKIANSSQAIANGSKENEIFPTAGSIESVRDSLISGGMDRTRATELAIKTVSQDLVIDDQRVKILQEYGIDEVAYRKRVGAIYKELKTSGSPYSSAAYKSAMESRAVAELMTEQFEYTDQVSVELKKAKGEQIRGFSQVDVVAQGQLVDGLRKYVAERFFNIKRLAQIGQVGGRAGEYATALHDATEKNLSAAAWSSVDSALTSDPINYRVNINTQIDTAAAAVTKQRAELTKWQDTKPRTDAVSEQITIEQQNLARVTQVLDIAKKAQQIVARDPAYRDEFDDFLGQSKSAADRAADRTSKITDLAVQATEANNLADEKGKRLEDVLKPFGKDFVAYAQATGELHPAVAQKVAFLKQIIEENPDMLNDMVATIKDGNIKGKKKGALDVSLIIILMLTLGVGKDITAVDAA